MMAGAVIKASLIAVITAIVLAFVYQLTAPSIDAAKQAHRSEQLSQVLPKDAIDGSLMASRVRLPIPELNQEASLYWGKKDQRLAVVLMEFVTNNGYSGDIRLLVAANLSGQVLGVRVLAHRETPGLGDGIEAARSDWILQFNGKDLDNPARTQWRADRLGGAFDTLSSATITSTAVIEAIRSALMAFENHNNTQWQAQLMDAHDTAP